jgi:1-acyl-sn-glycerol-3-phosphate acyltransferase
MQERGRMNWVYWVGWTFFGSAFRTLFGLRVLHRERLITDGPVLIASNHESFIDPPLVGTLYNEAIYYLARKTLFVSVCKWVYPLWNAIPVDQDRPDMTSLKTIIRCLKSGEKVLIFPEGQRTLDGQLRAGEPGVGLIASKARVVVQPIRIMGAREALPRGSGRIRFTRLTLVVGHPVEFAPGQLEGARSKEDYQAISDRIMAGIAELGEGPAPGSR